MEGRRIVYIDAAHIRPHPENPRKDLGDLSELAESIRKNGVLQNLTVIPVEGEPGEYMTLIGHRRYEAGVLAGVGKFPCKVAEGLTRSEQVSIMLEENMQRNDLTIWEQANGFQLMLDLGETEDGIAEKTGFSRTTVRHRLNIAKLDQEVLREKEKNEGFQLSLKDLYELEKIPDVRTRDRILAESTSSNNLALRARCEAVGIKCKEHEKAYIKLCEAEGIGPAPEGAEFERYIGKWESVREFELAQDVETGLGRLADAAEGDLFYVVWSRTFAIIRRKGKEEREPSEYELQKKATDKRRKQIEAIQKEMSAERADFIKLAVEKKFKPENEKAEAVMERLFGIMVRFGSWMDERVMVKFITGESTLYDKTREERAAYEKRRDGIGLLYKMMIYAADAAAAKNLAEYSATYSAINGKAVMELDGILALFGFSYSREEFYRIADGSHGLYGESAVDAHL